MSELRLKYTGDGKFVTAAHTDYMDAIAECQPGEEYVAKLVQPRSSRENRLFHGAIKSAYDNQRGGPRYEQLGDYDGWERLKGWLLCQAGWCDTHRFAPGALGPDAVAILKGIVRADSTWSVDEATGEIIMRVPRRINFRDLRHPDFQPVKTRVFDLLCNVIVPGTTPEQLMEIRFVDGTKAVRKTNAGKQRKRADRADASAGNETTGDRRRSRKDAGLRAGAAVEAEARDKIASGQPA